MVIIGCDIHPSFQQIAMLDTESGELKQMRLEHKEPARIFYESLRGKEVVIGVEACGYTHWFEQMLAEMGHCLRVGDAAKIRATMTRRQKTDKRDADQILLLLRENRFPEIWVPTVQQRDLKQLLIHRDKRVRMRTQVKNQLQAIALNQGLRLRSKLWSQEGLEQLRGLPLRPYTRRRREELLGLLEGMEPEIAALDKAVEQEALARPEVRRLMTHPGVGPVTGLAYVLIIGDVSRFCRARKVASYIGLIPVEDSSADKQRLGHISKQGSPLLRFLLVEAGHIAIRRDAELRRYYSRVRQRSRYAGVAKVAVARKLAVRLYWMLRLQIEYAQLRVGPYAGKPESSRGRKVRPID
jgi:transposase